MDTLQSAILTHKMRSLISLTALLLTALPNVIATSDTSVPFVPTVKNNEADSRSLSIRALLLPKNERRQIYYCNAPKVSCMVRYCCQNSSWNCCVDGSCCYPNYYCAIASNGNIGCCPDGKRCSGPVDDPTTIGHPTTITRTSTIRNTFTSTHTTSSTHQDHTTTTFFPLPPPSSSSSDPIISTPTDTSIFRPTPSDTPLPFPSLVPTTTSTGGSTRPQAVGTVTLVPLTLMLLFSGLIMLVV
ncbi:hypothetical protein CVT24_007705 [Panaeolus cyanescens]|uniref:Granulins domain-containing protein n=1 Tax=Panaeolus cyanescens TaxID=181874 RepID=A0A409VRA5_9AGAR|nr:hypothetical protein CVT24_007705 [Panaeolus cyanescens]